MPQSDNHWNRPPIAPGHRPNTTVYPPITAESRAGTPRAPIRVSPDQVGSTALAALALDIADGSIGTTQGVSDAEAAIDASIDSRIQRINPATLAILAAAEAVRQSAEY